VQPTPPLRRHLSGRLLAGVCGGIAEHLGIRVVWVRAAFAVLAALNGAGVVAYGLAWAFVPQETGDRVRLVAHSERTQAWGLAAVGVGVAVGVSAPGDTWLAWVIGPLGVATIGATVVWREVDATRRRRWAAAGRSGLVGVGSRRGTAARLVVGGVFVAGGLAAFLLGQVNSGQLRFGLLAVVATLVGVAMLTVPFWVRLSGELGEERRERIRSGERAEIAAHLHDSVLQTLALIQRQADQPREVRRLARGQERELRTWLYGPTGRGAPTDGAAPAGLAAALAAAAAEVEDTYAVDVRPVVVSDAALDERLTALVAAVREAMVNAAKHARVTEISVYAEVEPDAVHVFVRDRGVGFDPERVPADRHGLADSVRARMQRHGGTVGLRSAPGAGTEVHLELPVPAASTKEEVS
jgi:phage shock protein PspC (stress-responsive transcriptional regulator)/anti-sigma regulatory factor (Ser/Thr protein kinase)